MTSFYTVRFKNFGLDLIHTIEFETYDVAYQFISSDYFKMYCHLDSFDEWQTEDAEKFKECYNA